MTKLRISEMRCVMKRPHGFEVWAKWDDTAEVYELFSSEQGDDYIGCCGSIAEARAFALNRWNDEQIC